jgi:hypothetical protein
MCNKPGKQSAVAVASRQRVCHPAAPIPCSTGRLEMVRGSFGTSGRTNRESTRSLGSATLDVGPLLRDRSRRPDAEGSGPSPTRRELPDTAAQESHGRCRYLGHETSSYPRRDLAPRPGLRRLLVRVSGLAGLLGGRLGGVHRMGVPHRSGMVEAHLRGHRSGRLRDAADTCCPAARSEVRPCARSADNRGRVTHATRT